MLTYIFVRPFSKLAYKRLNYYLAYFLYSDMTCMANYYGNMEMELYCTDEDFKALGKENCFCVLNHKYDIDWLIGWVLCQRVNLLGGAKVVLKDSLKYIPVLGWSWMFSEYIFVKREWDKDQKTLVRDLNSILEYPKDLFYGINIFCESTRYTKEKHDACIEVAKEKGLPVYKHHLLPRPKGFNLLASQIAGHVDNLYCITIAASDIDGKQPTLNHITNGIPVKTQLYFRRIPMSEVPLDNEKEAAKFLNKIYKEKDEFFDVFHREGSFDSLTSPDGVKKQPIPLNGYDLIIGLISLAVIFVPSAFYMLYLLWNGSWLFKLIFALLIVLMTFITNWMVDTSNSKNASNFGLNGQAQSKKTPIDLNNNSVNHKKDK